MIDVNGTYTDAGATAIDNSGESIVPYIQVNNVDITQVGEYSVGYAAEDTEGNSSLRCNCKCCGYNCPIFILGDETVYIGVGLGNYTDAGATAMDNVDGN